jgi:hypothetical protein
MVSALWLLAVGSVLDASASDPFEAMLAGIEREEDYLELLNLLDHALRQPVNLLTADEQEIGTLPWISPRLAKRIVALRQEGGLTSVADLERVEGLDRRLVGLLRPFVTVEPQRRLAVPFKSRLRLRAVSSPASSSYDGLKTYARLSLERSGWRAGFLMEKDRGEFRANDFQALYVGRGWGRGKVMVGDFMLASGHGLVFARPFGYSPSTISPWRFSRGSFGIDPYASVEENFALRGVGFEWGAERFGLCLAASRSALDAGVDESGRVTSLKATGIHVSPQELAARDALEESLLGLSGRYGWRWVDVKVNLAYAWYDRPFSSSDFSGLAGRHHALGSIDLVLSGGDGMIFAEAAASRHGGEAVIGGVGVERGHTDFLMLGRYYDREFVSLHGRPFSYYSGLETGERGLFTCLAFKPVANGILSIGGDVRKRCPSERFPTDRSGSEAFVELDLEGDAITVGVSERFVRSEQPAAGSGDGSGTRTRLRSRVDLKYDLTTSLWLRARYENLRAATGVRGIEERTTSDLVRLDMGLALAPSVEIKAGAYTFSVGSYEARIYQYEAGLPYYPTLQLLNCGGSRWYSIISLRMGPLGNLTAKAGWTNYNAGERRTEFLFYYRLMN